MCLFSLLCIVTMMIARWRCYIQQKKYRMLKAAGLHYTYNTVYMCLYTRVCTFYFCCFSFLAITFQKHYRRHLVEVFVKRYRAAVMVQKHWKRWAAQRYYRKYKAASKAVRKLVNIHIYLYMCCIQ